VLTMYDARTKLSEEVTREVRQHFGDKVFSTIIPRSVRLSEAPSYGQPAISYDPSSRGSKAYVWLAEEFVRRFLPNSGTGDHGGNAT
ncbi:MAG: ParA family protein, partial [Candidatus Binatia bacterium]